MVKFEKYVYREIVMKGILPFDNVELLNDKLLEYGIKVVPALEGGKTYELSSIDTPDYAPGNLPLKGVSLIDLASWFYSVNERNKFIDFDKLRNTIMDDINHAHRFHYIIPVAFNKSDKTVYYWSHYRNVKGSVSYEVTKSNDLANWYKNPDAQLYSYEVEQIMNEQPYMMKPNVINNVKCVEGLGY